MNRLTIGARLGLAFGLVLLITALIATLGIWRVSTLKQANERIASVELERSAHAQQWRAAIDLNWTRAAASLKTSDEAYAQSLAAEMAATTDKASASQKQLEALMDDGRGKQLLAEVASGRTAYVGARSRLLERKKAGEDVAALVDSELRPLADRYLQALTRVTEHADSELRGFEAQTMAQATRSQWVLATAALVSVLLGVIFAVWATRSITGPVHSAVQAAEEISQGNLAHAIEVTGQDEMARLLHALANMQHSLSRIVSHVREGSENVSTASSEISQGNHDLSSRTEQQASALQQTAASMEELNATVKQNADNARQANQLAVNASTVAAHGGEVVGQVVSTMKGINDSSKKIADIIGVIDSIAFQTNILALNAAVEAARAGEQGRGFAVVASEVRNLAQRSAQAAKEIKALIDDSVQRVGQGTVQVDEAGITMAEVVGAVRRVTDLMGEISAASSEQSQGVSQVGEAVTQMDQVTQQNAALVEEMAAAASSLNNQARDLVETVAFFRLPDSYAAPAPRAAAPVASRPSVAVPARTVAAPKASAVARAAPALSRPAGAASAAPTAGSEADWESF